MPPFAITIEVFTTILLAIRLWSRFQRTGGRLGLDDLFISIAWALATVGVGFILLG
jgi:hypothetical protein